MKYMNSIKYGILTVFLIFTAYGSVFADSIDFNSSSNLGSISYAGGANPLVGTGISIDTVKLISGPPTYNVLNGVLSFTTGNFSGSNATQWFFNGGGTIAIIGCVDVNGSGTCGATEPQGTLLQGSFANASVTNTSGTFHIAGSNFSDTKNADLLALFGMPSGPYTGNFNLSFLTSGNVAPPSSFRSSSVGSGDVINTPGKIPEPASMLLFGLGLVGLAAWGRKRLRLSK